MENAKTQTENQFNTWYRRYPFFLNFWVMFWNLDISWSHLWFWHFNFLIAHEQRSCEFKHEFSFNVHTHRVNLIEGFSKHRPSGPILSISRLVRLSVRLSVRLCVCSLLRYRLKVFLPPKHGGNHASRFIRDLCLKGVSQNLACF